MELPFAYFFVRSCYNTHCKWGSSYETISQGRIRDIHSGSDLIRGILVHGAEDLGSKDVPNSLEGWGRLNLENSLYPEYSNTQLDTWYDQSQTLDPGRMFIYAYELDSSKGLEVTLAWNDEAVSSGSLQTSPKLLNDLDLVVIAPDGTTYLGNDFAKWIVYNWWYC